MPRVTSARERAEAKARARAVGLERHFRLRDQQDCLEVEKKPPDKKAAKKAVEDEVTADVSKSDDEQSDQ
jgi:hypothetical protein